MCWATDHKGLNFEDIQFMAARGTVLCEALQCKKPFPGGNIGNLLLFT
jgi:hypothetical protein